MVVSRAAQRRETKISSNVEAAWSLARACHKLFAGGTGGRSTGADYAQAA